MSQPSLAATRSFQFSSTIIWAPRGTSSVRLAFSCFAWGREVSWYRVMYRYLLSIYAMVQLLYFDQVVQLN
jgi:hypothetical protein